MAAVSGLRCRSGCALCRGTALSAWRADLGAPSAVVPAADLGQRHADFPALGSVEDPADGGTVCQNPACDLQNIVNGTESKVNVRAEYPKEPVS